MKNQVQVEVRYTCQGETHKADGLVEASREEHRGFARVPKHSLDFVSVPCQGVLAALLGHIPDLDVVIS